MEKVNLMPFNEEIKTDVLAHISKYLKKIGGYSNGLQTYVKGRLNLHDDSQRRNVLEVSFPNKGTKTLDQMAEFGDKLANEIYKMLRQYDIDGVEFVSTSQEYGCFDTYVRFFKEYEIRLSLYV